MAWEKGEPRCGAQGIHPEAVEKALRELPGEENLFYMSEFFRMFGDPTRLKIIGALLCTELCVCDLSTIVGMNQSVVSHHLKILRAARVITFRRAGKVVYYSLCDAHIRSIFSTGLRHTEEKLGEKKAGMEKTEPEKS